MIKALPGAKDKFLSVAGHPEPEGSEVELPQAITSVKVESSLLVGEDVDGNRGEFNSPISRNGESGFVFNSETEEEGTIPDR